MSHLNKQDYDGVSYRIDATRYTSQVEHRSPDMTYMKRQHHYSSRVRVVDAFGPLWLVGFSDLSPGQVTARSLKQDRALAGRYGFFASPFSIINWTVAPGILEWEAVASVYSAPPVGLDQPFLFKWNGEIPRTHADLQSLLYKAKDRIPIDQSMYNSSIAIEMKARIDAQYMFDATVSKIASDAEYDWAHLSREFKKAYGLAPVKYRNRLRLFSAIRLLSQGRSVTDACFESGFSSLTQFNLHFKEYLGTQPTSYSYKKNQSRQASSPKLRPLQLFS